MNREQKMKKLTFAQIVEYIKEHHKLNFMENDILRRLMIYNEQVDKAVKKLEKTYFEGTEEGYWLHLMEKKHIEYQLLENRELIEELVRNYGMEYINAWFGEEPFTYNSLVFFAHEVSCGKLLIFVNEAIKKIELTP